MIKKFKWPLIIIFSILLIFIIVFISTVEVEATHANKAIEEFIARGEYLYTEDKTEYYIVRKQYRRRNWHYDCTGCISIIIAIISRQY